jgi:hypothetical protein
MPLGATRCYLLDRLYSGLTCMNGCSCWSPLEGNVAPGCRCKRHALPLRHTPIIAVCAAQLRRCELGGAQCSAPSTLSARRSQRRRCTAVKQAFASRHADTTKPEENSLSEKGPGCQKARHVEIGVPLLQPDTDHVHHADDLVRTRLAIRVMPPTSFDAARVGGEVQR